MLTIQKRIQLGVFGFVLASAAAVGCDKPKDDKAAKVEKAPAAKGDKGDNPDKPGDDKPEPAEPEVDDELSDLPPKVARAVGVANKISAAPADAAAILEAAGMDLASYEALIYEIAKDPELSKLYAIAREA